MGVFSVHATHALHAQSFSQKKIFEQVHMIKI